MKLLLAVLFSLLSSSAFAQPYVFGGITESKPTIGGGYRFGKHFAVEGAYVDIGEEHTYDSSTGQTIETKKSRDGGRISAVGILPLTEGISFLGTLSAYYVTQTEDRTTQGGALIGSTKTSKTLGGIGVGAQVDFYKGWGVRAIIEGVDGEVVPSAVLMYSW